MSTFESLSKEPEFIKLDAKRAASLVTLINYSESLKELDQEKPSLRAFQRLESKIDNEILVFEAASNAVTAWFTKNGGDYLDDSGYKDYRVKAVKILNELEVVREGYHDLLKNKGLLEIAAPKHGFLMGTWSKLSKAWQTAQENMPRLLRHKPKLVC